MDHVYPFHPLQFFLDQRAVVALSACLSRMGNSVQLVSSSFEPEGFSLEISCIEEPSKEWLNEWFRQASLLMKTSWPSPVEMTTDNLKLFWKQKGQYLRAREMPSHSLMSVLCFGEMVEPFLGDAIALQSIKFDSLVLFGLQAIKREIKGHQEKVWLVKGRVAPESSSRKILSKLKPHISFDSDVRSLCLSSLQLRNVMRVQSAWLDELEKESDFSICARKKEEQRVKKQDASIKGWLWSKEKVDAKIAYSPLWLEPEFESISFEQIGLDTQIQNSLSFLLRIICKIVRILELEVNCSLRASSHPAIDTWLSIFESEAFSSLSLIEEEIETKTPRLSWQMSVCQGGLTWWPLAEINLTLVDKTKWELRAKPVLSFYRWAAATIKL